MQINKTIFELATEGEEFVREKKLEKYAEKKLNEQKALNNKDMEDLLT
jgi:hypothetical protein